jgi:hypothetical protein
MFALCDTETTIKDTIADFAMVICDRRGVIYNQIAVLVDGHYGKHKLFHNAKSSEEIWTLKGLERRNEAYKVMLNNGTRMLASVNGINKWIAKAKLTYPELVFTAYNSSFDLSKMSNTGIDTDYFDSFCLMRAAQNRVKGNRAYVQHCIDRKWFTAKLNARTNAEAMCEFVLGGEMPAEPHTALEDILDYEIPILRWLLKSTSYKKLKQQGYNWREWSLDKIAQPK